MKLKKELAVKSLLRIKKIYETKNKLQKLGVNLIELEDATSLLEEAIILLFVKGDSKTFETALDTLQWWIYDDIKNKKITLADKSIVDVNNAENFINWFAEFYK